VRTLAIAHRGDSAACPENTAAAFDAAVAAGADGIELDLRPTADGHVVVCHDHSLARFRSGRRPLARQPLARLRQADIGGWFNERFSDQRLVTLDELLERWAPRMRLLLELKAAGGLGARRLNRRLCKLVAETIARHDARTRVYAMSFRAEVLRELHRLDPTLRLGRITYRAPRDLRAWLARQPPLAALSFNFPAVTRRFVADCHARGLAVFTWTCNDERAVSRSLAARVDGVLSDRAGWLVKRLRSR
jgi:glycerophosphoryl diester phosphodiesterase